MKSNTEGTNTNNPHFTTDQIVPLVRTGYDAAKKYGADSWDQLLEGQKNQVIDSAQRELNAGGFGDQQVSGR